MLRRTFLAGTAAALAALAQKSSEDSGGSGSLAYIQDGTLWIKRLPDGAPRAVAAGNAVYEPKFSPSGRWILFRDGDDLLRLVSADGKRAKSWVGSGRWLPGREELAVYYGEESNRTVIFGERDDWNSPLRTLTDPIGTISPDGSLRVWESSAGEGTRLFLGPFAEPGEPRLVAETAQGGFQVFGFARGGSRFLYWMTDEDGANVWSYGLDFYIGGGAEPVKTGVVTLTSGYDNMMSLSPTASTLAAAVGGDHFTCYEHSIALVDISDDSKPEVRRITGPLVSAIHPAWSPDGRQLVWSQGPEADALGKQLSAIGQNLTGDELSDRALRGRRIWLAGDRGLGEQKQLTNDARYYDEMPVWSRDGSHILLGRWDEKDTRSLWLMRADGSDAREVAGTFAVRSDVADEWPDLFDWSFR
jgi:Tol biopolymer transport system component